MMERIVTAVLAATGAKKIQKAELLQSLWSGYGSIVRYTLQGADMPSVVVKHVSPPIDAIHPRGWNTDISHQRKLKSYEVEAAWYLNYATHCLGECRIPNCLAVEREGHEIVMVLEDLDAAGFSGRKTQATDAELETCLEWLANHHARFLSVKPEGLWNTGTYWHLATRPDELEVLAKEDFELHTAASAIDAKLKASPFQTLVHGDAKLANFCFSDSGRNVAVVDFQYVGRGCGVSDVAYFVGSCLSEEACTSKETYILDYYFSVLRGALIKMKESHDSTNIVGSELPVASLSGKEVGSLGITNPTLCDLDALEANWRSLYPVAWADFHRFLKGWSPGHWKINGYGEKVTRTVISQLNEEA